MYISLNIKCFYPLLLKLFILSFVWCSQDTVDILVGWHIDTSQSIETNKRISQCIFRLSTYWTADMSFTLGLLEQLLEDMSSISDGFEHNEKADELSGDLDKILAFIRYANLLKIYSASIFMCNCFFLHLLILEYLVLWRRVLGNI